MSTVSEDESAWRGARGICSLWSAFIKVPCRPAQNDRALGRMSLTLSCHLA